MDKSLYTNIPPKYQYSRNIAVCSFLNTLIKFDSLTYDITIFEESVYQFLVQITKLGCSVIVIDNKSEGMSTKHLLDLIKKFSLLIEKYLTENNLEIDFIPIMFLISLKNDRYKKPYTNIFKELERLYSNNNSSINLEQSIIIGNKAGRLKQGIYSKDINCDDRAFAYNIGIKKFMTPENLFSKDSSPRKWSWSDSYMSIDDRKLLLKKQKYLIEPPFNSIFTNIESKNYIFISGPPSSGKSLLSKRIEEYFINNSISNSKILILDINKFEGRKDILFEFEKSLKMDYVVIIIVDSLYNDYERNLYFTKIPDKKYYFEISTKLDICQLLNSIKVEKSKTYTLELYKSSDFYTFKKKYQEFNPLETNIEYVTYPLKIRTSPELFYHY